MKKYIIFSILTCMTCLFYTSCEKTGLQVTSNTENQPILTRGDCDECPGVDECCCAVWLEDPDDLAFLRFCGTSDGASACSGTDICGSTFMGGGQQIDLNSMSNPKQIFCMLEGNSFYIYNYSISDVAELNVTCQDGLTNPQVIQFKLQPSETFYFDTDGSCEIIPCQ